MIFPETDFLEARGVVSFSGHVASTSATPSGQILAGQGKRSKQTIEVDPDLSHRQKPSSRVPHSNEDTRIRTHTPHRETGFGNSNRVLDQQEDSSLFAHPGELVICKKKRKDREKSAVKSGSPVSVGRNNRSSGSGSLSNDTRLIQQTSLQQGRANQPPQQANGSSIGGSGWANPVKRTRTDTGKRRASHL